ncbi:Hypothetical Protein FCC1311_118072 [Hondaea fermentalgiana]|uniref:Uncharacterized protein n=1 Tax=Hondaea fermentalgiana TaxID=2315210 RepID=A0A2R5FDD4_9STRA|nr:Hypothetical Protein FCC1311_118072 [Hondaea fermentalgiana]|eukprot:GBG16332.1 Hypothetical Protein FCC1311_118072 [Hondaea fermentalgiana]
MYAEIKRKLPLEILDYVLKQGSDDEEDGKSVVAIWDAVAGLAGECERALTLVANAERVAGKPDSVESDRKHRPRRVEGRRQRGPHETMLRDRPDRAQTDQGVLKHGRTERSKRPERTVVAKPGARWAGCHETGHEFFIFKADGRLVRNCRKRIPQEEFAALRQKALAQAKPRARRIQATATDPARSGLQAASEHDDNVSPIFGKQTTRAQ